ncbi:MAG TPA: hypothetical protein VFG86_15475 [Chloroflexota bacterium]|jgi:hypothetical protein|nr:hypothetical protein [Chloroflexota bacterium]
MELTTALLAMEAALADADALLVTVLGGQHEEARVRVWRGQVLVDWEPDDQAGGCMLRPTLVRRLVALHAHVEVTAAQVRLRASGNILAALSPTHEQLVRRLGGARKVELRARLQFADGRYLGGEEVYAVLERGRRVDVLVLRAALSSRVAT